MSNRNYRQMGTVKLLIELNRFDQLDEADQEKAIARAGVLGVPVPATVGQPVVSKPAPTVEKPYRLPAEYLKPMLAFPADRPVVVPTGDGWVMEPKYDGIRFLVHVTATGVKCYGGRNGSDHTGNALAIEQVLEGLPEDTLLDGELTVDGGQSGDTMSHLADRSGTTIYVVFDVLRIAGNDFRSQPFATRRDALEVMNDTGQFDGKHVQLSPQFPASQETYEAWVEAGWEGAVAKRQDGLYRSGKRSRDMLKLKHDATTEAVVIGYVMGKGESNRDRVGALKIRLLETGTESTCGYDCAVGEVGELMGKTIEIAHMGIFEKSGAPRHPRFMRMRPDRDVAA